jgi:5-methylcytosine-specific restriction enzyme subunit McrC
MITSNIIQVYEYGTLRIDTGYGNDNKLIFTETHFKALSRYLSENKNCGYYELFHRSIRFKNYVGVIKVGDLTIEVLPKCDRYDTEDEKTTWQRVLIEMLTISLKVEAKITTMADISIKQHSVLETYLNIFLNETAALVHQGLVKKYRTNESNQNALKGKLQIHKQVTINIVHAERFYVSHTVYDRDNIYNAILYQAMLCIRKMSSSLSLTKRTELLLLDFPECASISINHKLFERLRFDRKTERYKTAINLAKIILMNYHPDIKGGKNDILAIMFDMNLLWENYIYYMLKKNSNGEFTVKGQSKKYFWKPEEGSRVTLRPDIVIERDVESGGNIVLDTKWKYQSDVSVQDLRQMYAYGKYFDSRQAYLVYPEKSKTIEFVRKEKGGFYEPGKGDLISKQSCGLLFVDLLKDKRLNNEVGKKILSSVGLKRKGDNNS